jgi:hypothetical protein
MMASASDTFSGLVSNRVAEAGDRHVCRRCGQARARFSYAGRYKARRDHDLCQRCFRTLKARLARWAAEESRVAS